MKVAKDSEDDHTALDKSVTIGAAIEVTGEAHQRRHLTYHRQPMKYHSLGGQQFV